MSNLIALKSFEQLINDVKTFHSSLVFSEPTEIHDVRMLKILRNMSYEANERSVDDLVFFLGNYIEFEGVLKDRIDFCRENIIHALSYWSAFKNPDFMQYQEIMESNKKTFDNEVIVWCGEALHMKNHCGQFDAFSVKKIPYNNDVIYPNFRFNFEGESHYVIGSIQPRIVD